MNFEGDLILLRRIKSEALALQVKIPGPGPKADEFFAKIARWRLMIQNIERGVGSRNYISQRMNAPSGRPRNFSAKQSIDSTAQNGRILTQEALAISAILASLQDSFGEKAAWEAMGKNLDEVLDVMAGGHEPSLEQVRKVDETVAMIQQDSGQPPGSFPEFNPGAGTGALTFLLALLTLILNARKPK